MSARKPTLARPRHTAPTSSPTLNSATPRPVGHPIFAQPESTVDPTKFRVKHPSDRPAYQEINQLHRKQMMQSLPYTPQEPRDGESGAECAAGTRVTRWPEFLLALW